MGNLLRGMSGVLSNNLNPLSKPSAELPPLQPKTHWERTLKPVRTKSLS